LWVIAINGGLLRFVQKVSGTPGTLPHFANDFNTAPDYHRQRPHMFFISNDCTSEKSPQTPKSPYLELEGQSQVAEGEKPPLHTPREDSIFIHARKSTLFMKAGTVLPRSPLLLALSRAKVTEPRRTYRPFPTPFEDETTHNHVKHTFETGEPDKYIPKWCCNEI